MQHDAQRKQIAAMIHRTAQGLLGGHVRHGANHGAELGLRDGGARRVRWACRAGELRKAEIKHLDEPTLGQDQIGALDVAMHHA